MADVASARTRLENNFIGGLGLGYLGNKNTIAAAVKLGYGLDIRLDNVYSLMPTVSLRTISEGLTHIGLVGADYDGFVSLDLGLQSKFYISQSDLFLAIGPYFSIPLYRDTYYVDYDPSAPIAGLPEFKRFDIGIQPGFYFELSKHLLFGLEANIGLRNMMIQYPEFDVTGSRHISSYLAVLCLHF